MDIAVELNAAFLDGVLRMAGPILFIALQVSCVMVAFEILKMKSVKKFSSIPFACMLANGTLWAQYGWLKSDYTLIVPSVSSMIAGLFCMLVYYRFSVSKPVLIYSSAACVAALGSFLMMENDAATIGMIGCVMSIMMSGSPLAVISVVFKEKSTASLPFWTSFITWLNTLSWMLYGLIIAHDNMITLPNALGFVLASFQMSLFVVFGFPSSKGSNQRDGATDGDDDTEKLEGGLANLTHRSHSASDAATTSPATSSHY